jgi:DNA-binding NarL/FixJ family response regulator
MATKILVVDDAPDIRRSLRFCIEEETSWEICGEAENGKVAVEMVRELHPDVVLLDLSMPVMNGLEAARQIGAIAPQVQILMFTLHAYPQLVEDARNAGIRDVISKSEAVASNVLHAIRSMLAA